jgi:large subunit ribosomal protein L15
MQLNTLVRKTKEKGKKRVGRGGKRGTYSGRGIKGQKARAGHRIRPEIRDLIKKIPKRRGRGIHVNTPITKGFFPVNLDVIEAVFSEKDVVTPKTLLEKGLIGKKDGKIPPVKILGMGAITKALSISGCVLSGSAREKIEKAGGKIA